MSKQSEAKAAQGYTTEQRNCGNCAHLKFEMKPPQWMARQVAAGTTRLTDEDLKRHEQECNHCCGLGRFAIKKTATCTQWQAKPIEPVKA